MKHINRPQLPTPLTVVEIERLRRHSRASAAALVAATLGLISYAIASTGILSASDDPVKVAIPFAAGVIAALFVWAKASDLWTLYIDLPQDYCWSANQLFGKRRELDAFRRAIIQIGRPLVWQDYWTANKYDLDIFSWEIEERQRERDESECKKLYGIQ